jgi:hypothetical protein
LTLFFKTNKRTKKQTLQLFNLLSLSVWMVFYAVAVGRRPGIYEDWDTAKQQVYGFANARHKKFKSRQEAEEFIKPYDPPSPTPNTNTYLAFSNSFYALYCRSEPPRCGKALSIRHAFNQLELENKTVLIDIGFKDEVGNSPPPNIIIEYCGRDDRQYQEALLLCSPNHPKSLLENPERLWYPQSTAILIGINKYADRSINSLSFCVNDAQAMNVCLQQRGFKTTILLNEQATKAAILRAVLDGKRNSDGRLVIYFAGHGNETLKAILPYDFDPACRYSTCIQMSNFGSQHFDELVPKHLLYVLDCCHSANGASVRGSCDNLQNHLRNRARDVLTAGQHDQTAGESNGHGHFTRALVDGLNGGAYLPGESWISAAKLAAYVLQAGGLQSQTPQHFRLFGENADGMFIFEHPNCRK